MRNQTEFLDFKGKAIYMMASNGITYIALKPICDGLKVDWIRQFKNVKDDEILGPALSVQTMQVEDKQSRQYACLPEDLIYGWLFSINSTSPELKAYKWECYRLLYKYFKGSIPKRLTALKIKSASETQRDLCKAALFETPEHKAFMEADQKVKAEDKTLKQLDTELLLNNQLSMFPN